MTKKKTEISKEDLAFVTLIKSGRFRAADAFRLLFDSKANDASLLTLSSKKKTALAEWFLEDEDEIENLEEFDSGDEELDKAALIKKFTKIAHNSKDDKVKLAAYEKIANIKNMKKEIDTPDDDRVHFYVPVVCHKCNLYAEAQKKLEDSKK